MVVVRRILFISTIVGAVVLNGYTAAAAVPRLVARLDRDTVQLGHSVTLDVYGQDLSGNLSDLPLGELKNRFGVKVVESATAAEQHLRLKLYPRRAGNLEVPTFALDGASTQPLLVHVYPAAAAGSPVTFTMQTPDKSVWTRQQIRVRVQISTAEKFVELKPETATVAGFDLQPLPVTSHPSQTEKNRTVYVTGWVLRGHAGGNFALTLPAVRYIHNGITQREFYPPTVSIRVNPLPPYVPPTMPVGMVTVTSAVEPSSLLSTDGIAYWTLTLHGNGVPYNELPAVLRQLDRSVGIDYLPAGINRANHTDRTGIRSESRYRIPFTPAASGFVELPALRIQYFDPNTGRIRSYYHRPPERFALGTPWRVAILLGIVGLISYFGPLLYRRAVTRLTRLRHRRRAISDLRAATTPTDLYHALETLARAEGFPRRFTLASWLADAINSRRAPAALAEPIETLQRIRYGGRPPTALAPVKSAIVQTLTGARPD